MPDHASAPRKSGQFWVRTPGQGGTCVFSRLGGVGQEVWNLKRAGKSPGWMWLSLLNPLFTFAIFLISLALVQDHKVKLAREAEAQRLAMERHAAAEQRALPLQLSSVISDATQTAVGLSTLMRSAERALDLAELEFDDGAFAAFWDAIEEAVKNLAKREMLNNIQRSRKPRP